MSCGAARVSAAPRPRGATHRTQMCLDPLREEERRENVDVGGRGGRVGGGEAAVLRRRGAAGGRVGEGAHALGGALAAVGAGGGALRAAEGGQRRQLGQRGQRRRQRRQRRQGGEGAGCARRDRDGGHGVPAAPAGHHRRRDARRREADREAALLLLRQQGGAARRRRELRGGARRGRGRLGPRLLERLAQRFDADLRLELRDQLGFVDLARLVRLQQRAEVGHAGRRVEEADERAGVDRARGGAGGGGGRRRGRAGSAHIVWRAWTSA